MTQPPVERAHTCPPVYVDPKTTYPSGPARMTLSLAARTVRTGGPLRYTWTLTNTGSSTLRWRTTTPTRITIASRGVLVYRSDMVSGAAPVSEARLEPGKSLTAPGTWDNQLCKTGAAELEPATLPPGQYTMHVQMDVSVPGAGESSGGAPQAWVAPDMQFIVSP